VSLFVLAMEIVPAGNRTTIVSLLALATGAGSALAVLAIPVAAAGRWGLAAAYGLQLLGLPLVLRAVRRLPESDRFLVHVRERHGLRALVADLRGRKRVGVPLGAVAVVAFVGFLLVRGVAVWPLAAVGNALASASGVALIVYGPEMLPTRVRAAGNNAILAMSVTGSAV